jgi:hypothetical protein
MVDDINYLKGKLMAGLKIPKAFMGYEEDTNGKATLAALDVRFAKTVERIQRVMISELTKIAIVHLYAQGITDDRLTEFSLELTIPSKIYEQERVELYTSKVALIQQMQQTNMFSKEWMYEAIMGMAQDEQDQLTLDILEDTKQQFRLTSIETQGVDPAKETGTDEPTNVEEEILSIGETFNEAGLPFDGRFIIVAPWVISKMVLAGLTTKTSNDAMWANGFVDRILGFNIYMSQNVSKNSTSWDITRNIAGIEGESFGYAEQIVKVEAFRPQNAFSDAVKGLHLYGGKVMRPDKSLVWYADKTAEG